MIYSNGAQAVLQDIQRELDGTRIGRKRREIIEGRLRDLMKHEKWLDVTLDNERNMVRDLRIHLRDRDAHIRNLEAQLRPYLSAGVGSGGNTEAML